MNVGKYGHIAEDYLKNTNEEKYNNLKKEGVLTTYLEGIDKQAHDYLHEIMDKLIEKYPVKDQNNFMERVQHMNQLKAKAEELVLNDIIYKDN